MHMWKALLITATLGAAPAALAEPLSDISGGWVTDGGKARVDIGDCGDGSPCGVIAWLNPETAGGTVDGNNPDPALQARPLVGVQMLWGFEARSGKWVKGRIYNPEDGKTYGSRIALESADVLVVKGCFGPICKTQRWNRAG